MHLTAPAAGRRVEAFRQADEHGPRAVARFLPPPTDPDYLFVLTELVREDAAYFAARGEPRTADDYCREFPELAGRRADLTQTPLPPTPTPRTAFTAVRPVAPDPTDVPTVARGDRAGPAAFPAVGDDFAGFQLVEELGQGAFGRVFLAEEWRLAGRKVVLKITLQPTNEPQRLARLQHTNIVPIQNAFRVETLSAVQMPYFGRQTLADLIAFAREDQAFPKVASRVFSTTAARQTTSRRTKSVSGSGSGKFSPAGAPRAAPAPADPSPDDPHPIREMLARMPYVDAVVWLAARLADGLAHAHARGILHLDLKPQNVLFSDDGQPMLLDFNLGFDVARQDRERIGGTWPYMPPEQIEEYLGAPGAAVDARTDLFALGVVLFELLTGRHPFPPVRTDAGGLAGAVAARRAGPPSVRAHNPAVPASIDAVVRKLLAPAPADRYQSADDLRTDLDLHQANRPLRFAPNPSLRERAAKWRRRHPRALATLLLVAAAAAGAGSWAAAWQAGAAAARERADRTAREFHAALVTLRLDLTSPGDVAVRRAALDAGARWFDRYGVPAADGWADVPAVRDLPAGERAATADALGELAVLMAHAERLEARAAAGEQRTEALTRAVGWNRTAEKWFAATSIPAAVWEQREAIADAAGDPDLKAGVPADRPAGEPARIDLFLRGVSRIAAGEFAAAIGPLAELADRERNCFAAHFALAHCYHQTSQHQRALERYQMARALAPRDARPAYNRGLILLFLKRDREAEAALTEALDRNPRHADSYWHRALARRRLGDAPGAIADLTRGLDAGVPRLSALLLRAELHDRVKDAAAAAADRAAADRLEPTQEPEFITRGLLRLAKDPAGALADFERALAVNPRSLAGWQNKAAVLADYLRRPEEALAAQAKAVELHPEYGPARMGKAVLLARLGRRAEAHREAAAALVLATDPQTVYQAANVYAITSGTHPQDRPAALAYFRQALREGFRQFAVAEADPDMTNVRGLPEFQQALRAARELVR